ncbi:hypothetical protein [Gordonia sihwensis]|uniref:hypothetical protein n=1 Tax=Gordonia sihwensis TaxID=173559 RepID=UPI003D973679
MADPDINQDEDGWNQPHVAARLVDGRPMVFINPDLFSDGVTGDSLAEQVAASTNSLLDVAEVHAEDITTSGQEG